MKLQEHIIVTCGAETHNIREKQKPIIQKEQNIKENIGR
jgi:hypothetical protein